MINKELIKEKEYFILEYIKECISQHIQKLCQFETSMVLLNRIIEEECEEIHKLNEIIKNKIAEVAPFHRQAMYYPPLCTVTNDASCLLYNQRFHSNYLDEKRKSKEDICSKTIQYA